MRQTHFSTEEVCTRTGHGPRRVGELLSPSGGLPGGLRRCDGEAKVGVGPLGVAVTEAVRAALDAADLLGRPRKAIAARLSLALGRPVTVEAVYKWTIASAPNVINAEVLMALAAMGPGPRQVLPEGPRRMLAEQLARLAGGVFVAGDPVACGATPAEHALEITAAVGSLAERARAACSAASPNGRGLSAAERAALLREADKVQREIEELRGSLGERKGGA